MVSAGNPRLAGSEKAHLHEAPLKQAALFRRQISDALKRLIHVRVVHPVTSPSLDHQLSAPEQQFLRSTEGARSLG